MLQDPMSAQESATPLTTNRLPARIANHEDEMKALLILGLGALLLGCDLSDFFSGRIGKAIRHEVREKKEKEIDLAKVLPFEWDELFLYEPYTSRLTICKDLELKGAYCMLVVRSESEDDGEMFLVLRHKTKIVHTEMYGRFNGDFIPLDFKIPVTPSESKFVVKEDGRSSSGEPWLRLRPSPTVGADPSR